MIDGSETRKRRLASSRVFEKGSNLVNFSIEKSSMKSFLTIPEKNLKFNLVLVSPSNL